MPDIARLGIAVETIGVEKGESALDNFSNSAKRADAAAAGFSSSTRNAGAAAAAAATGIDGEAGAAQRAARALDLHGSAANSNSKAAHGLSTQAMAMQHSLRSSIEMMATGVPASQILGSQINHLSYAMSGEGGLAGAAKALGASLVSLLSPANLVGLALAALAIVGLGMVDWGHAAAAVLNIVADSLNTIAPYAALAAAGLALMYAPAIIAGLYTLVTSLGAVATGVWSIATAIYATVGLPALLVAGFVGIVAAAVTFRDELTQMLGVDIVGAAKTGANIVIGAFLAAYHGIAFIWGNLPDVLEAAAIGAVNAVIRGLNTMISKAKEGLNDLIGVANRVPGVNIPPVDPKGGGIEEMNNPAAGRLTEKKTSLQKQFHDDLNADYINSITTAIGNGAAYAAGKVKELASWMGQIDAKSKKAKGTHGKTDDEKYSDIVDGANRKIASLKAEQAAVGLSDEAAAKLEYTQDLLNEAQRKGITLTAAQTAELTNLAGQMASTQAATERAKEALSFAKDATKGFMDDLRQGLENGEGFWKSFGNAALNVLDKIVEKIEGDLIDALFDAQSAGGGGGGIGGLIMQGVNWLFGAGGNAASAVSLPDTAPIPTVRPFANGTDYAPGGLSRINERGGEIVKLPSGTQVFPHDVSMRMAANANYRSAANQNDASQHIQIDVGVYVDDDGNLAAVAREAGKQGGADAADVRVQVFSKNELPDRMAQINAAPRRRG